MSSLHGRYIAWATVLLMLLTSVGCEQQSAKVRTDDTQAEGRGSDEESTESGADGLGQICATIGDCSSYLSCIDGACQIPPAVTGRHESDTPRVRFIGEGGDEVAAFYVELALTAAEHEKGLMYRRAMKDDWGMLFIYPDEAARSFWMQNTFISLDMVFMDGRGRIVNIIEAAEPLTRVQRRSKGGARYVLELNAGRAADVGLERGHRIEFENIDEAHAPSVQK